MKKVLSMLLVVVFLFMIGSCGMQNAHIVLTEKKVEIEVGDSYRLSYELTPEKYSNKVEWTSSDENVAIVDQDGFIEGIAAGECEITVSVGDATSSTCRVIVSGGEMLVVPDIQGLDETTINNTLSSLGLVPVIEYENSDNFDVGEIISVNPAIGQSVEPGERVTVTISSGSSCVVSEDSYLQWWNVGNGDDNWEFYSPYIEDGSLYIEFHNVILNKSFSWLDTYNYGYGGGVASLTDSFDITVPVKVHYDSIDVVSGESMALTIEVPLSEFQSDRPTTVYFDLIGVDQSGNQFHIYLSLSMTW